MKNVLIIGFFCFIWAGSLKSQVGERFMRLPKKYELPTIKTTLEPTNEDVDEPWRVYTDRDSVLAYTTDSMDIVVDTLHFMEEFVVWEESETSVRLVSSPDTGSFMVDGYFGNGSRDRGWVNKQKLILWPRVLSEAGTLLKVLAIKKINATVYTDGKLSSAIEAPEDGFKLFNVLKIENKDFLLCKTDLVHPDLSSEDLFWINSDNLSIIWDRKVLVPDWEKISNGKVFRIYSDLDKAIGDVEQSAADTFPSVNPYLGFFNPQSEKNNIYSAQLFLNQQENKVYLNNLHNDYKVAQLVDANQFLVFKEFYQIFSESMLKNELEDNLIRFFRQRGISNKDLNSKNIRELLEMVSGLRFTPLQSNEIIRVKDMKDTDFRFDYLIFTSSLSKLSSEKDLEPYSFYSDILYYWLPESWIRPDLLSSIKLSSEVIVTGSTTTRKTFSEFDLLYIDNSAPAEEKSYEQMQAEITRYDILFTRAQKRISSDIQADNLLYYSNTLNPIIGRENATLNNIVLEMRTDKTSSPIRFYDKNLLEDKLMLDDIEQVEKVLNIHYFISDKTYEEEINDRALLLDEMPQRLKSIVAKNAAVNVYLYLYGAKSNKIQMETLINSFIQKETNLNPSVKYTMYEFN
jgi:hypothetical protein